MYYLFFVLSLSLFSMNLFSDTARIQNTQSIPIQELKDFNANPLLVKKLLNSALGLASQNLGYLYGSSDPGNGGMDCSGTVYYLLTKMGIKEVPRSSDSIYHWVKEKGHLNEIKGHAFSASEFSQLRPGDLLFWNGTYDITPKFNVSHIMIYLGKNQKGEPLMIGASDGRSYQGKKVYGVSVFNFQLPDTLSKSTFLGYSCTPDINCSRDH